MYARQNARLVVMVYHPSFAARWCTGDDAGVGRPQPAGRRPNAANHGVAAPHGFVIGILTGPLKLRGRCGTRTAWPEGGWCEESERAACTRRPGQFVSSSLDDPAHGSQGSGPDYPRVDQRRCASPCVLDEVRSLRGWAQLAWSMNRIRSLKYTSGSPSNSSECRASA